MVVRSASCSCGQLKLTCRSEPVRVSICHCFDCQRRTGSVFGVQARFDADQVEIEGEATAYRREADSGNVVDFFFCGRCGGTTHWQLDGMPESLVIAVGCFADPSFPVPGVAVYEARQHPWSQMPGLDVEHWD